MQSTELDPVDRALLALLQSDGRITNAEMARRVNLSPPAVLVRVRRLEEMGVICRYVALLAPAALGFDMLCFLQVTMARPKSMRFAWQCGPCPKCWNVTMSPASMIICSR
jgi:Lrp/AsnC family leucine-responsive transcriptional regulator